MGGELKKGARLLQQAAPAVASHLSLNAELLELCYHGVRSFRNFLDLGREERVGGGAEKGT
jgi:hypothetical protein